MLYVGKWMNLKITTLNKLSQTQKDKYHIFPYIQSLDPTTATTIIIGHECKRDTVWERNPGEDERMK
jgi:hypothetical protein